ncbi:MAG: hypothetical protein GEU99_06240 [Luteitalea sp.]|nr:hypothetical protein [Luteitalea sp.]
MTSWQMVLMTGMLGVAASALGPQSKPPDSDSPFVCNIDALTPSERAAYKQISARVLGAIVNRHEIADGYLFEVDRDRLPITDLATWVAFERRCCSFFDFRLDVHRENGPVTLRLTGPDGVKSFIEAEFGSRR